MYIEQEHSACPIDPMPYLGVCAGCLCFSRPSSDSPQNLPVSRVSDIPVSSSPPISLRKYGQLEI